MEQKEQYSTAAASFVFLYNLIFGSSWLLIQFIYPTKMFPRWTPARGNAFGVAARAVGYGGGPWVVPIVFADIQEKTYYVFGAAMVCDVPLVYCFLPESCGRTLEAMDFLLASKSSFTWGEEREFSVRMDALQVQLATKEKAYTTYIEKDVTV